MNPIVFIVGCPRSGTTLLQRLVDSHPRIAIVPEVEWIPRRYQNREGLTPDGLMTPQFAKILRSFGRYSSLPISQEELRDLLAQHPPLSYSKFISLLFDRYGKARGKELVGNKTVDHARNIATLHELWPEAKFVHLVRDGRDVCLSALSWRRADSLASRFSTWSRDPVSTAALWWEWHVRLAREAGRPLGSTLYHEIRYESLVDQPAAECRSLCEFLQLPFQEEMLRFHEKRAVSGPGLDAKHQWLPPTRGLRDWRKQMSQEEIERFEAAAGELLDELGYERRLRAPSRESLQQSLETRRRFEGSPLPRSWHISEAAG
jgi:hypothetical protein